MTLFGIRGSEWIGELWLLSGGGVLLGGKCGLLIPVLEESFFDEHGLIFFSSLGQRFV